MTEKEHLENWLDSLKTEHGDFSSRLKAARFYREHLKIKQTILQEMIFQHGSQTEQIKEHLDYAKVSAELQEVNSDAHLEEEDMWEEKVRILQLAIDKIEARLPHASTSY